MRVYLVGAGVIARTHAEAAAKLGEPIELRVADPDDAMLADFLDRYPHAITFPDVDAMLGSEPAEDDDVVIVATPPVHHWSTSIAAARSGRHVLCEKPLAMSVAEAEEMLEACESSGVLFGTCSTRFRGLPHSDAVKRVIAEGLLGDLYSLDFTTRLARSRPGIEYQEGSDWFLDSARSGGGVVMDWGPYDISSLVNLLRPVRVDVLAAWTAQPRTAADRTDVVFDVETDVGAALRFWSPETGTVTVSYGRASATHADEHARAELVGTAGAVSWVPFDSHQPVVLRTDADGQPHEAIIDPPERDELSIFDRPLVHFHAALRGRPLPASIGRAAVDEFRLLRAIYDVARTGRPATVEFAR